MKFKFQKVILLSSLIFILTISGLFSQTKTKTTTEQDTVLIEINGNQISTKDLRNKINTVPPMNRHHYKSIKGQKQVLDYLVQREIFYAEAINHGYDQVEEVKKVTHQKLKPIINQLYFEEILDKDFNLSEEDLQNYYTTNRSAYTIAPKVTIQYLQTDEEHLEEVQQKINSSIDFEKIISEYSLNELSIENKGIIRNIRLNGFISGIGRDTELDKYIADANIDPQTIHGPFTTSTGIHFFKKLDYEPAIIKTFQEVKGEIENRLKTQKENEIYTELMDKLRINYEVKFYNTKLDSVNIFSILPEQRDIIIAEGNHPEIVLTLGEVGQLLKNAAQMERMNINEAPVRENIIKRELDSRILYADAQNQNKLEQYKNKYEIQEIKKDLLVNYWYNNQISNSISVSEDEINEHYAENTEKFTIPASRNLRQFVANDEKSAKKHLKKIKRFLKKNQEEDIINYIKENSLKPEGDGLIKNVYANGIIPGVGKDELYNDKVWELKIKEISDIFKNQHSEVVFFYVIDETPESVRPLEDIEASIKNIISRRKAQAKFEQVKDELIVKYNANPNYELLKSNITAEELFTKAEEAQKKFAFAEAVFIFDQIISDYEGTNDAYKAAFMKAFVTAEELKDKDKGIIMFEEFINNYPEGDLHEDARFMLETLKSGTSIENLLSE
jgi:hypothetical protein